MTTSTIHPVALSSVTRALVVASGLALCWPATARQTTEGDASSNRAGALSGVRLPATPKNLAAVAMLDGGFRFTWQDLGGNETQYEIERTPSFTNGAVRVGGDVTEFVDAQDRPEVRYRVRAINGDGSGRYSAWTSAFSSARGFEVLTPGSGFSGATSDPAAIGTADVRGFDARAIARWNVVPFQTFTGNFQVGVVAFHMNGVDRVDFSVNGGPWRSVTQMQLNPRTKTWEYTALLRATDFTDGPVEVRAIAYPRTAGLPRVLEPLRLFSNGQRTLPALTAYVSPSGDDVAGTGAADAPFKSIFRAAKAIQDRSGVNRADGGTVFLTAGDHDWGRAGYNANGQYIGNLTTVDRWLEIKAAPGVGRDLVRIASATSSGGLKNLRTRLTGLTLLVSPANAAATGTLPMLWIDDCRMVGPTRTTDIKWVPTSGYAGGAWVTESEVQGGRYGILNARLVRNTRVSGTGDDAFTNNLMLVNVETNDLQIPAGSGYHGDVFQLHASATPLSNIIIYNLRATNCLAQPWHVGYTGHVRGPDWSDIALVNVLIEAEGTPTAQWIPSTNHLLLWHSTILGAPVILRDSPLPSGQTVVVPTTIRNISFRNNIFQRLAFSHTGTTPRADDSSWATNNHFIDTTTHGARTVGTFITTGGSASSLFINSSADDYRPQTGMLRGRFNTPIVPRDAAARQVTDAIGALQP